MGDLLEILDWGIVLEEFIPNEEDEVWEWPELDFLEMYGVIGILARPEAEVEAKLERLVNMKAFGVSSSCLCIYYRVENTNGFGFLLLDRWVLDAVGLKLPGEVHVQSGVGLGIEGISWVRETIQEVVFCNPPPCLINQLFPKLVQTERAGLNVPTPGGYILERGRDIGD